MTARMHILCVVSPISFCSPYHTLNLDETFSCLSIFLAFLESMYLYGIGCMCDTCGYGIRGIDWLRVRQLLRSISYSLDYVTMDYVEDLRSNLKMHDRFDLLLLIRLVRKRLKRAI